MNSLSQTTGYAIEALACLARQGSGDSMLVREIAESTSLPLPYLSKIFHRLADAGIVESKRGYKGGVKLSQAPEAISLLQIGAAVEAGKVAGQEDTAATAPARPNTFWEAFHMAYRERLAAMTLADVLDYRP